MADTEEALAEANRIYQATKALYGDVSDETKAMEAAVVTGNTVLRIIDSLSSKAMAHVDGLGSEIRSGFSMSNECMDVLGKTKAIELAIHQTSPPAQTWLEVKPFNKLPYSAASSEEARRDKLMATMDKYPIEALQSNQDTWDVIASEFKTFEDMLDKSLQLLIDAETSLQYLGKTAQKTEYNPSVQSDSLKQKAQ